MEDARMEAIEHKREQSSDESEMMSVSAGSSSQALSEQNQSLSMPSVGFSSPTSSRDEALGIPSSRPTRESVLKRLGNALLRRSLTKIDLSQRELRPSDAKLVKMALYQNSSLSVLKLGYNNLGDEGTATLAAGIAVHKALELLDLGFNKIGDYGCRALAGAMLSSSCPMLTNSPASGGLHTLYLSGNLIGEDGALELANVIRQGCTLRCLHLAGNRLGPDGVAAITEAIIEEESCRENAEGIDQFCNEEEKKLPTGSLTVALKHCDWCGLQELFLGGTGMGTSGCLAVARLLQRSTTIRVISLSNCSIGDDELDVLAIGIKENKERLPLEALHLSFNDITCKGLDSLMNAIWGSTTLRELLLDNNEIGDRGAQQVAALLPHVKSLQVLDLGFNSIKSSGVRTIMKVVAQTQNLTSLSISGNAIDTSAAKVVAYSLAYNRSLRSLSLVRCYIEHEGQRHIAAGIVSNSGTVLRKLSGFKLGPILVTIGLPSALEDWSNERVLNFVSLMWDRSKQDDNTSGGEKEVDPLNFLPNASDNAGVRNGRKGPLDATVVVDVARKAFQYLGETGPDILSIDPSAHLLDSPLAKDAIMVEGASESGPALPPGDVAADIGQSIEQWFGEATLLNPPKSFVAPLPQAAKPAVPDPLRKRRILDWLACNVKQLKEMSKRPFSSTELWRLHQHYFTPVVNETGGGAPSSPHQSSDKVAVMVSSVPEVSRGAKGGVEEYCNAIPSVQASAELTVPTSEPVLPASPPLLSLPLLKRKVSYRCLGEAAASAQPRPDVFKKALRDTSVSKLIQDGKVGHTLPPKTKRARRNKTRISFLPRIKNKLDSYLDLDHEKALVMLRKLHYVEQALLAGEINPYGDGVFRSTHLCGVMAEEAEMILLDMM